MSLNELWEASSAPYHPIVSKESQFTVGFTLLLTSMFIFSLALLVSQLT
jgi:cell cycle checkpoint protein